MKTYGDVSDEDGVVECVGAPDSQGGVDGDWRRRALAIEGPRESGHDILAGEPGIYVMARGHL